MNSFRLIFFLACTNYGMAEGFGKFGEFCRRAVIRIEKSLQNSRIVQLDQRQHARAVAKIKFDSTAEEAREFAWHAKKATQDRESKLAERQEAFDRNRKALNTFFDLKKEIERDLAKEAVNSKGDPDVAVVVKSNIDEIVMEGLDVEEVRGLIDAFRGDLAFLLAEEKMLALDFARAAIDGERSEYLMATEDEYLIARNPYLAKKKFQDKDKIDQLLEETRDELKKVKRFLKQANSALQTKQILSGDANVLEALFFGR